MGHACSHSIVCRDKVHAKCESGMSRSHRFQVRRCALQAMYELDQGGTDDSLVGRFADESMDAESAAAVTEGQSLAARAWETRHDSDEAIAEFVTDWPTHRQPIVDRNVLRLAWYEISHGGVPPAAAIDQAVDLAKEFGGERSPAFVNAVLDRWWKCRDGVA